MIRHAPPTPPEQALLSLEDSMDRHIAEQWGHIEPFVDRHFSLQDTIVIQTRSLLIDLLCCPINTRWAIPYVFVKKTGESLGKLGWETASRLLSVVPSGMQRRYQKEIKRSIRHEILEWTSDQRLIESYGASRTLASDLVGSFLTLATGWLIFGDHSLGIEGIGERIASKRAKDKAASSFILGSGLGSIFYSVFPPKPSLWEIVLATAAVGLLLTICGMLIGVLADPIMKRLGLHQRQMHALLDDIEDRLHRL